MEAIILAGGKAERLGDAAGGRPKALVEVAGKPLAAYQVGRLARAGVTRVIFACAAGQGELVRVASSRASARRSSPPRSRSGSAAAAGSSSQRASARGGRRRLRAERRRARRRRLRRRCSRAHRAGGALATITVAQPKSQFGLVDVDDEDVVHGFREGGQRPVLGELRQLRALATRRSSASPTEGDHESSTFPELAAEGRLRAFRHDGPLAHREHAEGAARRRRARRRASGVARVRASRRGADERGLAEHRLARPLGASTCGRSRSRGATS